jgi:hypothetical protein
LRRLKKKIKIGGMFPSGDDYVNEEFLDDSLLNQTATNFAQEQKAIEKEYSKIQQAKQTCNIKSEELGLTGENHCLSKSWNICFPNMDVKQLTVYQEKIPDNRINIFGFVNQKTTVSKQIDEFIKIIDTLKNKNIKHSWLNKFSMEDAPVKKLSDFLILNTLLESLKKSIIDFSDSEVQGGWKNLTQIENLQELGKMQLKTFNLFYNIVTNFEEEFTGYPPIDSAHQDVFSSFIKELETLFDKSKINTYNNTQIGEAAKKISSYYCSIWYDTINCTKSNKMINIGFFITNPAGLMTDLISHSFLLVG